MNLCFKMITLFMSQRQGESVGLWMNFFFPSLLAMDFQRLYLMPFLYYNSGLTSENPVAQTNNPKTSRGQAAEEGSKLKATRPSFPVHPAPPMLPHKKGAGEALVIFLAASSFHFPWKWYFTTLGSPLQQYLAAVWSKVPIYKALCENGPACQGSALLHTWCVLVNRQERSPSLFTKDAYN